FKLGLGRVDLGHFEADMVLAAERVLLEELHDWRAFPERLDQLDLGVGRVDETDPDALCGQVEGRAMRVRAEPRAVELKALLDRWRRDADMVQAAEFHH